MLLEWMFGEVSIDSEEEQQDLARLRQDLQNMLNLLLDGSEKSGTKRSGNVGSESLHGSVPEFNFLRWIARRPPVIHSHI